MERTHHGHRIAVLAAVALLTGVAALPAPALVTPADPRIVGGEEVSPPGEYPFMVALVASGSDSYNGQFCGGSLIAPGWVMTAAHCVVGETANRIDVVIGRHDLKGGGGERIGVASIRSHPDYNDNTTVNDVAVLELDSDSVYAPVSLPPDGSLETAGRQVTITGWGDTQSNPRYPATLHEVDVPIVADSDCSDAYGNGFKASSMLCAGNLIGGGEDSCQGDSGGPLFLATGDGFTQLGIVSWGNGCARPGYPGIYSRVSALQGWVTQVTGVDPGGGGGGGGGPAPTCDGVTATIWGTAGNDTLTGTAGRDVISGLGGDDIIDGRRGNDLICAGDGDDVVRGGDGADVVLGGNGDDTLYGGNGNDRLVGAAGADRLYGAGGDDRIVAGTGDDVADGGAGGDTVLGGAGADQLSGGPGDDTLKGGRHDDVLRGDGGNDTLVGAGGHDQLIGGWGLDWGSGGAGVDGCSVEIAITCE